ncbi:MAG: hypothetical protein MZW92_08065 [Comamonadaceae bacterium]|nr:hypothetical protein [Comamonadaceae bacterium]
MGRRPRAGLRRGPAPGAGCGDGRDAGGQRRFQQAAPAARRAPCPIAGQTLTLPDAAGAPGLARAAGAASSTCAGRC